MLSKILSSAIAIIGLACPTPAVAAQSPERPWGYSFQVQPREPWDTEKLDGVLAPPMRLASSASWYGPGFYGNRTANGEVFTGRDMTAAHRTLPFGTRVRVTNLNNGRSTVVRVNDRGPFIGGRVIDLSEAAASRLGMISSGTAPVRLEVLR